MDKKGQHWRESVYGILAMLVLFLVVYSVITFWPQITEAANKIKDPAIRSAGESGKVLSENLFKGLSTSGKLDELKSVLSNPECSSSQSKEDQKKLITIYQTSLSRAVALSSKELEKASLVQQFNSRLLDCCKTQGDPSCVVSIFKINKEKISTSDKSKLESALVEIGKNFLMTNDDALSALNIIKADEKSKKELSKIKTKLQPIQNDLNRIVDGYRKAETTRRYEDLLKDPIFNKQLTGGSKLQVDSYKASIEFNKIKLESNKDCSKLIPALKSKFGDKKYEKIYFIEKEDTNLNVNRPITSIILKEEADCLVQEKSKYYVKVKEIFDKYPNSLTNKIQVVNQFREICRSDEGDNTKKDQTTWGTCKLFSGQGCYWVNTANDNTLNGDDGTCRSCLDNPIKKCDAYSKVNLNPDGDSPWFWQKDEWQIQCESDPCGFSTNKCVVEGVKCVESKTTRTNSLVNQKRTSTGQKVDLHITYCLPTGTGYDCTKNDVEYKNCIRIGDREVECLV